MPSEGSVTFYLNRLKQGDLEAINPLLARFEKEIVALARKRLPRSQRAVYDEDDVVASVFESICGGIQKGRFQGLKDRQSFSWLIKDIARKKIATHQRHETRQKRDARRTRDEAAIDGPSKAGEGRRGLEQIPDDEASPEELAMRREVLQRLFELLPSKGHYKAIAFLNFADECSQREIAEIVKCSETTVGRRIGEIKKIWERAREHAEDE